MNLDDDSRHCRLRIPADELREIRNAIPLHLVMKRLGYEVWFREHAWRFRCPRCHGSDTSISKVTNLGRCFTCSINYNTIDATMIAKDKTFLEALTLLRSLKATIPPQLNREA
jgi:hypothetical protein